MSDEMKNIYEYPDISFIENYTLKRLTADTIGWFMGKREELSKEKITLGPADDRRIILQTCAYIAFLAMKFVDNAGKQNLLKYSSGPFLDNLGAMKHMEKEKARNATVTLRYSILSARESATGIPAGSRASAGDGVYFETNEYAEIAAGSLYVDVRATCSVTGIAGNMYGKGEINQMTDKVPFVDNVTNMTEPENGFDEQNEESLREAIFLAPESHSAAGPESAYRYFAKKHIPSIIDVRATSPKPRVVEIRFLLEGGEIPGDELISSMTEYLSGSGIKMLTDVIRVVKPETLDYEISATYWINASDKSQADMIQEKVGQAVDDYILWQKSKIGRDLNPSELTKRIMAAGAKRVRLNKPEYFVIDKESVAMCSKRLLYMEGWRMIRLEDAELIDFLPPFYREQVDVVAISYAFKMAISKVLGYAKLIRLYSDIDHMPEFILDYMAVELRAQYYLESMDLELKREIIKNALHWHMKAGTTSAVEELVQVIFGTGKVIEWDKFEDGPGEPGTFDIVTDAISTSDMMEQFTVMIQNVKNLTSHLRSITTEHETGMELFAATGTAQAEEITVSNDFHMDNPDQAYIQKIYVAGYDCAEVLDKTVTGMGNKELKTSSALYVCCGLCQEESGKLFEKGQNETQMTKGMIYAAGLEQEETVELGG